MAGPVFVMASALMVLILAGIGLELWRVVDEHRRLSGLAEGAALSGATAIDIEALYTGQEAPRLDPALATGRACDYLDRHGDITCSGGVRVVITGASIEVVIRGRLDLTLLRLVEPGGYEPIEVVARGTATAFRTE